MISDDDMRVIDVRPRKLTSKPTSSHVHSGTPIPKPARVRLFSPDEWEEFVAEWLTTLDDTYTKVRRYGGSGDFGIDIAGYYSDNGLNGEWDNYQCKRFAHPLRPSDVWVEIGKILYYSYIQEYSVPRSYYFVASLGVGTTLERLLGNPCKLKSQLKSNWDTYCRKQITAKMDIELEGDFLTYVDIFNFSIFSSKSHIDLIQAHALTSYHVVRFGGGLPQRPEPDHPPDKPEGNESRYIRQLLDAYGDFLHKPVMNPAELRTHQHLKEDFLRQRERFYHAESLRNFARDTVPEGTFSDLQEEIYYGVIDIATNSHTNGFTRMKETVSQAARIPTTANPLAPVTKSQDRQGICHQLANEDRLTWVPNDD